MNTVYRLGNERIVYKSRGCATGKSVSALIWDPNLIKDSKQYFTELEGGLYYLDYTFSEKGKYIILLSEDDVPTTMATFVVIDLVGDTTNINRIIQALIAAIR